MADDERIEELEKKISDLEDEVDDAKSEAGFAKSRAIILQRAIEALSKEKNLSEEAREAISEVLEELG
jgi:chromosome segregation ATPase